MSAFDPYHKWLGIPPAEQPPHHYRLLGVAPFESDLEVIESAADRQMSYVRQCATGPYTKESQQLLNELSTARICLLNAGKKAAYDRELKARLAPPAPAPESRPTVSRPRVTRIPADRKPAGDDGDEYPLIVLQRSVAEGEIALPPRRRYAKKRASLNPYWLWGGAGGVGLLLLWGLIQLVSPVSSDSKSEEVQVAAADAAAKPKPASQKKAPAGAKSQAAADVDEPRKTDLAVATPETPFVDDLLKRITPSQNTVRGVWNFDGTSLVSPATDFALLQVPVTPTESYILRATVEAAEIRDCLSIGLVVGSTQVTVILNGWKGTTSGLQLVDVKMVPSNETKTGPALVAGSPNQIVCTVTPGQIEVTCNEKRVVNWKGDFKRLLAGPDWEPPNKRHLYLGTNQTAYRISKLELQPISSPPSAGGEASRRILAPLKILEATYGSADRKVDLTARMQKGAEGGLLVAFVEPALCDGKASGDLLLRYRMGNQEHQRTYRHREFVLLDVRESPPVPAKGLVIREALYGAGIWGEGRMVDVKERLLVHVKGDRVNVSVKDLVSGIPDPAFGVSKVLMLRFALDGRDSYIRFDENMAVRLGEERKPANEPPAVAGGEPDASHTREIVERILQLDGTLFVKTAASPAPIPVKTLADVPADEFEIFSLALRRGSPADLELICSVVIGGSGLALSGPNIGDDHLAALVKAKSIVEIRLDATSCTDAGLVHLSGFTGLQRLGLIQSQFTAAGWKHLQQIPELNVVQLITCDVSRDQLASLAELPKLSFLQFQGCQVDGGGFRAFRGKHQIQLLVYFNCALDASGMQAIGEGLPELKFLDVANPSPGAPIDDEVVEGLRNLKQLQVLRLDRSHVTDKGLAIIAELRNLNNLVLNGAAVTGTGFRDHVGKLSSLKNCVLSETRLSDEGLRQLLAAAPKLENLMIVKTAVTDIGLNQLKDAQQLKNLTLSKDRFSAGALNELREALPTCKINLQ